MQLVSLSKSFQNFHRYLSRINEFSKSLRFLAYLKNDLLHPRFEYYLIKKMIKGWEKMAILDIGCGKCQKEDYPKFKNKENFTCFDIFEPYLRICRKKGFQTVRGEVNRLHEYFPPKSFDIVWILDVIEHLTKKDGAKLLARVESIARKQVIIFTPSGWLPQDIDIDRNRFQKHLSSWTKADFEDRGYLVEVISNYFKDVRFLSRSLSRKKKAIPFDIIWATKLVAD